MYGSSKNILESKSSYADPVSLHNSRILVLPHSEVNVDIKCYYLDLCFLWCDVCHKSGLFIPNTLASDLLLDLIVPPAVSLCRCRECDEQHCVSAVDSGDREAGGSHWKSVWETGEVPWRREALSQDAAVSAVTFLSPIYVLLFVKLWTANTF